MANESEESVICARCCCEMQPGTGSFFNIAIEAIADATPPIVSAQDLSRDLRHEIRRLLHQLEDVSAQEAMDQVFRRLTIVLCNACYRDWIENPAR